MVILASVRTNFWLGLLLATALISGAGYSLWMFKRVYFGAVGNDNVRTKMPDISWRECTALALLAIAVLWMGIFPKPFTDVMDASVANLVKQVGVSKLN